MLYYWKKLKINQKILYPIIAVSILTGLATYIYFYNTYEETQVNNLISSARNLLLEAEAVREFSSEQWSQNIYDKNIKEAGRVLYTVPIFSAMKVAGKNAKQFSMEFKVPKFQPRNMKNMPDEFESRILKTLEDGTRNEIWEIDEASNKLRYFRPIKLTEECLLCHGNPSDSYKNWGRTDGKDITGGPMENWKAGEIHGAFEVKMSLAPVQASVKKEALILAFISAIGVGIIILVGYLIAKKISGKIGMVKEAAEKVAGGDTTVKLEINSADELGQLSVSFNGMVDNIRHANESLQEEKRSVERKVEEAVKYSEEQKVYLSDNIEIILAEMNRFSKGDLTVKLPEDKYDDIGKLFKGFNRAVDNIKNLIITVTEAVHATASASAEISSSTEQMAAGAQNQSAQTSDVAAAVEEMAKTVIETSRNASAAAEHARNSGEIARGGGRVVADTVNGINTIADIVSSSAETVSNLGESSARIGAIIEVIEEIAEQTNLLALNAAIEAARAGNEGAGFAVVADEVRKLADRTSKATQEIASMIKQIQVVTDKAVTSMASGINEVEAGKKLANSAGESLDLIISSSNGVLDEVSQVAAASEQQSITAEQISRNIDSINNVTLETVAGIQQVARAAEDLNRLTENLQDLIGRFAIGHERARKLAPNKKSIR
jgi:methyl-accepting chemotaxis protein